MSPLLQSGSEPRKAIHIALDQKFPIERSQIVALGSGDYGTAYRHMFEVRIAQTLARKIGFQLPSGYGTIPGADPDEPYEISLVEICEWMGVNLSTFRNRRGNHTSAKSTFLLLKGVLETGTKMDKKATELLDTLTILLEGDFMDLTRFRDNDWDEKSFYAVKLKAERLEKDVKLYSKEAVPSTQ